MPTEAIMNVSFELRGESALRYQDLMKITEAPTHSDLIKNALRLYEFAIKTTERGAEFLARSPDGEIVKLEPFG